MFLYNVTVIADSDIHGAMREAIEQQLRPYPKTTVRLLELVDSPHEGITYCIHLYAEDEAAIEQFQQTHLQRLQQLANSEYAGKVLFFDSKMKYLIDFSE